MAALRPLSASPRRSSSPRGAAAKLRDLGHERARGRYTEVRAERVGVGPVFEKDEPQRLFHVTVNRVQEAPRLLPRPVHVRQAQLEQLVDAVGTGLDAAGDDEHARTLAHRRRDVRSWGDRRAEPHDCVVP